MAEIMTAREAVERYIKTGTQVCWGGFSYTRRPYTIAREVIRQRDRIQHLFCTMNGGASIEEALAANDLISRLETTYIGLEGIQPVAYSIRRRIQDGSIPLFEDYSNYGYATRTIAGRFGWPFAPLMAELGSDVPEYDVFGKAGLRGRNAAGSWINPRIPPKKFPAKNNPFIGWGFVHNPSKGGEPP